MDTLSYKTISANKATVTKEWVIVDATDQVLGRLGAKVAKLLRGKYKPNFTPHVDCGDNVIIINADKVKLTGNKWNDKVYLSYTGYPGGQREITPARLQAKPNGDDKLLRKVVKGMLPKNKLGAKLLGNMYVYAGSADRRPPMPGWCRPPMPPAKSPHSLCRSSRWCPPGGSSSRLSRPGYAGRFRPGRMPCGTLRPMRHFLSGAGRSA